MPQTRPSSSAAVVALAATLLQGCRGNGALGGAREAASGGEAATNTTARTGDAGSPTTGDRDERTGPPGHLTLAIVVDQLSLWEWLERVPKLPSTKGFRRLWREARVGTELRYDYVQTSTAIGHSTLFTGRPPHDTGITSNEILDSQGRPVAIVVDPSTRLVTPKGTIERPGASLAALAPEIETLGDALRRQRPEVTIACVSMKDRGAVFACGRKPDAVLWFDTKTDAFVTSTAYGNGFPLLGRSFGEPGVGARYRSTPWVPRDVEWASRGAGPGVDVGQGNFEGMGSRFPHDLANAKNPPRAMLASPMSDELLADLAIAMVQDLPRGRDAFLSVSFSAHDYVLHTFGPDAPEAWDELLRLDSELARLLDALDSRYGADGYGVVLSADHGGPPAPEGPPGSWCSGKTPDRFERPCTPAIRLDESLLAETARKAAERALGQGEWVLGMSEPFLHLTPAARSLPAAKRERLVSELRRALLSVPGVVRVVDAKGTESAVCPASSNDSTDALLCRSLDGEIHGDLLVVPDRGAFYETGYVTGDGCNHGTPYLFDRTVPLLIREPSGRSAATTPFEGLDHAEPSAYSGALSDLLGIQPPNAAKPR